MQILTDLYPYNSYFYVELGTAITNKPRTVQEKAVQSPERERDRQTDSERDGARARVNLAYVSIFN